MVRTISAAIAMLTAGGHWATAQDWPTRTVSMVVPFPAGGPIDVVARILAPPLGERLGQQIIIDRSPMSPIAAPGRRCRT